MRVVASFKRCAQVVAFFGAVTVVSQLAADDLDLKRVANLVQGNEHFGRTLLEMVHREVSERNVVVCPISIAITFAALQHSSADLESRREIGNVFGWGADALLALQAQTLLATLEKAGQSRREPSYNVPGAKFFGIGPSPDESSITNTILFRSKDPTTGVNLKPFAPEFAAAVTKYFGMKLFDLGASRPSADGLGRVRGSVGALPATSPRNDVWISSGLRLRTAWSGNTFSLNRPITSEFRLVTGDVRKVEMNISQLAPYRHAITDSFEAVVLPGNIAYLIVVLPAPGKDIHELERELVEVPDVLDAALKPEIGVVTIPTFHIVSERDMKLKLEELGIRKVFKDLPGVITFPKSFLSEVAQRVDIQVDHSGIRANAETVTGAVYGGILSGNPFRMRIDRPFLFLVRDSRLNSLLLIGAVMDPTRR